jgi:hypothetical protein
MKLAAAKLQGLLKEAADKGLWVKITEIHRAVAGLPDEINEEYISFPAGCVVMRGTSVVGLEDETQSAMPQMVFMQAVCSVELAMPPMASDKKVTHLRKETEE